MEILGISDDEVKPLNNTTLAPQLLYPYYYHGMQLYFRRGCLVNENNSISNEKVLNIYIVYHLDKHFSQFSPKNKKLSVWISEHNQKG